jgi:deferrochelatase/peroxidase EfeB
MDGKYDGGNGARYRRATGVLFSVQLERLGSAPRRPSATVAQGSRELETFFVDPVQAPGGQAVAAQLGFHGDSAPDRWWDRQFVASSIDLAIHASFDTPEQKTEYLDRLRASAARHGLQELALPTFPDRALSGKRPAGGRLHFGYRDGITTPNIDWDDTGRPGTVDVRELVVGYPNDDYPSNPRRPGPWQDFARDGSYVGLAWIYQDVAGFNRFLQSDRGAAGGSGQGFGVACGQAYGPLARRDAAREISRRSAAKSRVGRQFRLCR